MENGNSIDVVPVTTAAIQHSSVEQGASNDGGLGWLWVDGSNATDGIGADTDRCSCAAGARCSGSMDTGAIIHPPQEDGVCVMLGVRCWPITCWTPAPNSAASSSDWWSLGGCGHDRTYPKLHGPLTNHSHRAPPFPLLFFVSFPQQFAHLYFSGFPSINTQHHPSSNK